MEFLAATVDLKSQLTDQVLFETFSQFDTEGTGHITIGSFMEAMRRMGNYWSEDEAMQVLNEYAYIRQKGSINFEQFKNIMLSDNQANEGNTTPYPRAFDVIGTPNLRNEKRDFANFTTALQTADIVTT